MSVLQNLLNLGLVDIGSEDSRFEKMQSASKVLATKLTDQPTRLIPATMAAIDESMPDSDPLFDLVEELVVVEWKTLRNTHVNRPRELLRSIIIDAIAESTRTDAHVAFIVWNTAVSMLRHKQVNLGKAGEVIMPILNAAAKLAEAEAVARAAFPNQEDAKEAFESSTERDALQFDVSGCIDKSDVLADVARAAGPNHPSIQLENPNPHWTNQPQHWSHEFSTRMAEALANAVSLGSERLAETLSEQLSTHLRSFEKSFDSEICLFERRRGEQARSDQASRLRLEVLWWSHALYSPLLNSSYRELEPPAATVAAAVDLANIVPSLSPTSVTYVLDETLRRALTASTPRTIQEFLDAIADADLKPAPADFAFSTQPGRMSLGGMTAKAVGGVKLSIDDIRERSGINPKLKLSPGQFAMWVFRDLQAIRLAGAIQ